MTTAVTGATGHVGASLVRALLGQGRRVRVLVRNDERAVEGLKVEKIKGDVLDPASLLELFKGADTVFHLAAKISLTGSEGGVVEKTNIQGTKNVIEACLRRKVKRLVHFSSIHAFSSPPDGGIIDERNPLATGAHEFPYDRSKALSQMAVINAVTRGLDAVIINPTAVIGPLDFKPSFVGEMLIDIYRARFGAVIDGGYDWVDSRDVVACALAAEKKGKTGECYLASGHRRSFREVSRTIGLLTGRKTPSLVIPVWPCIVPAYCSLYISKLRGANPKFTPFALKTIRTHTRVSHEKSSRELGYNPRPFEETIRDILSWFRDRGLLE